MFDRGLIGLWDDIEVLVSRHANDRDREIVTAGVLQYMVVSG